MGAKFLPLEISGKPLSQYPRRSVLLKFCKQTKQPNSNYDHNSGRKLLFCKYLWFSFVLLQLSFWLYVGSSIVALSTAELDIYFTFFKIRIISVNTRSPFVCLHFPNSKSSSRILSLSSENCKHNGNYSLPWISTSSAIIA